MNKLNLIVRDPYVPSLVTERLVECSIVDRIDFVEDLLQFFIEKDTVHRQSVGRFTLKGRDVRGYVYCGLVSLLKHYYFDNMKDLSIIQSKSDHINIVIEYYNAFFRQCMKR